ncbi:lysosomal alpha-mannosidase-like [Spodoptera frugiperda]|uniref:Lysosomal alpha-mannosidase-like n=1 Tax=Spodoptera frugiperda TaxID=7108 RepID=A0A9R0E3X2_SPOFR|nr:lysosomal alpha-mannosidase-like [Spodoptera frugiperda]
MNYIFSVIFIVLLSSKNILSVKNKIECGYKQCPQTRDGALNVHLIPHSHMDAGWVKTFDEYYYGTKTSISTANVQLIYHSVLSELLHDKRRKFTFSETAYFWRWWKEQRPTTRATFRTLVQEGRVEFAGGGWVHNDEATPDYLHIIDQYTWGLRKLNDTLGPCGKPKAAWQIDTYGHTREQVSLLAQMGYDGLFIGRVDHKQREAMIEEDRMEFMWRGSDVLGKMSDIMTHTLFNLYNAPDGFCFDFLCNDEPIIDDPDNKVYNADKRVNDFISQIERQAKYYDHDNIMVTMGGDFTYQSAANWFMNMDKLINHVNTHPANLSDINIFYSTPSCYLKAIYLYGRRDKAVYTEKDDQLPYGSDSMTYWTGYYTSRPSLKYFARRAHVFLQVVKQLTVIARLGDSYELHLLRHAVSLVLHHDAITGTSQQHVASDFVRILSEAIDACTKKVSNLLSYLTPTWGGSRRTKNNQQFVICHQLNMSQCRFTENQESMLLLVYNPLSVKTYHHVRLPAIALHYTIRDFNDEEVEYQLVPLPAAVINLPGRSSTAIQELCFEAENIPPLGFTAYYIAPVRDQLEENEFAKKFSKSNPGKIEAEQEIIPFISNEYIKVTVDKVTGLLESIQHVDGVKIDVGQNFYYYAQGQQTLQSGAYSFRPDRQRPVAVTDKVAYNTIRGSLVKEIRQRFSDWITQIIRLYRGEEFVEMEWIIGPIPIGTDLGKEVVSLFTTNITSNGEFFTDSNSRQMMRRTCWNESANNQQIKKPIAACYYPVTSRICIHSGNASVEMCVLVDRTEGGTSYNDGEIELMVHRRLLTDDGFGLEETLNEESYGVGLVVKGKHRILFGNYRQEVDDQTFSERMSLYSRKWQYEPWLFLTSGEKLNRRKWQNVRNKRFSVLKLHGLPRHIHVLTLEPWKAGTVLLRLENTLESPIRERYRTDKSDGPEDYTSKPTHITVELRKIFLQMNIKLVRETTLAANQWLDDARQMDWSTRYVYNGADDGILPEDAEETEDKPPKPAENKDSDEDAEYGRKKYVRQRFSDKSRSKIKTPVYADYDRRKRSINVSENVMENIINDTTLDEVRFNDTTASPPNDTSIDSTTRFDINNTVKFSEQFKFLVTQKTPKMSFLSRMKPSKLVNDWAAETEEVASSEEDFSSNLKKRSPRRKGGSRTAKRPKPEAEPITDDVDDGITKSIYEMYYKHRPRNQYKPLKNSEEGRMRKKKARRLRDKNDYDYELEPTTRRYFRSKSKRFRGRGYSADMPFFLTDGKKFKGERDYITTEDGRRMREMGAEDGHGKEYPAKTTASRLHKRKNNSGMEVDYSEEEDLDNIEKEIGERRTENNRRKRTLPKDDEVQVEPGTSEPPEDTDFVVTIRPTQIRTFVIWFENNRKNYNT